MGQIPADDLCDRLASTTSSVVNQQVHFAPNGGSFRNIATLDILPTIVANKQFNSSCEPHNPDSGVSEINAENGTGVNRVIDDLERLPELHRRSEPFARGNVWRYDVPRVNKVAFKRRRVLSRRISAGNNSPLWTMLHRSRPDLIKGITARSSETPSTSSQGLVDALSQSTSENSLHSSGSTESPSAERLKPRVPSSAAFSRGSSIGDASGSSTPTQLLKPVFRKKENKRAEIVASVTSRLYAIKKRPDPRLEALQAAEKEDEEDDELEELKLCKRARMKLFDLSRKLAMAKKHKRTVDSDTQTEWHRSTLRVKEKSICTDQQGVIQLLNSATNTPLQEDSRDEFDSRFVMNHVVFPNAGNFVLECGPNLRVQVPSVTKSESASQTLPSCTDQTTSPKKQKVISEDHYSDDSLDSDETIEIQAARSRRKRPSMRCFSYPICRNDTPPQNDFYLPHLPVKSSRKMPTPFRHSHGICPLNDSSTQHQSMKRSVDSLLDGLSQKGVRLEKSLEPICRYNISGTNAIYEYDPNKAVPDKVIFSNAGENIAYAKGELPPVLYPQYRHNPDTSISAASNESLTSQKSQDETADDNFSSGTSFVSTASSLASDTSSDDFVFIENAVSPADTRCRELYTISENSESCSKESTPLTSISPRTEKITEASQDISAASVKDVELNAKKNNINCNTKSPIDVTEGLDTRDTTKPFTINKNILPEETKGNEKTLGSFESLEQDEMISAGLKLTEQCQRSSTEIKKHIGSNSLVSRRLETMPKCLKNEETLSCKTPKHNNAVKVSSLSLSPIESQPDASRFDRRSNMTPVVSTYNRDDEAIPKNNHIGQGSLQNRAEEPPEGKKMNWSELRCSSNRQFHNFNYTASQFQSQQSKDQSTETSFPSEDSITFVFLGPKQQQTSVLFEVVKRGLMSSSDRTECSRTPRSRSRGVQCTSKLLRSVSVDTAMIALSRIARHQQMRGDITRTNSMETLLSDEISEVLMDDVKHDSVDSSVQCMIENHVDVSTETLYNDCAQNNATVDKCSISTSTSEDKETETELKLKETTTQTLAEKVLFEDTFPELPRRAISVSPEPQHDLSRNFQSIDNHWKEIKHLILGTSGDLFPNYLSDDTCIARRSKRSNKSVSWSDFEKEDSIGGESCDSGLEKNGNRRVRFSESQPEETRPKRLGSPIFQEAASAISAFLQEATSALQNFNGAQTQGLGDRTEAPDYLSTSLLLKRRNRELTRLTMNTDKPEHTAKSVQTDVEKTNQLIQTGGLASSLVGPPVRRSITPTSRRGETDESNCNSTWPRRRVSGKPPTGQRVSSSGRSPTPARSGSLSSRLSGSSANWTINSPSSSSQNSPVRRSPSRSQADENYDREVQESCRRLEIAVEHDRARQKTSSARLESWFPNENGRISNFIDTFSEFQPTPSSTPNKTKNTRLRDDVENRNAMDSRHLARQEEYKERGHMSKTPRLVSAAQNVINIGRLSDVENPVPVSPRAWYVKVNPNLIDNKRIEFSQAGISDRNLEFPIKPDDCDEMTSRKYIKFENGSVPPPARNNHMHDNCDSSIELAIKSASFEISDEVENIPVESAMINACSSANEYLPSAILPHRKSYTYTHVNYESPPHTSNVLNQGSNVTRLNRRNSFSSCEKVNSAHQKNYQIIHEGSATDRTRIHGCDESSKITRSEMQNHMLRPVSAREFNYRQNSDASDKEASVSPRADYVQRFTPKQSDWSRNKPYVGRNRNVSPLHEPLSSTTYENNYSGIIANQANSHNENNYLHPVSNHHFSSRPNSFISDTTSRNIFSNDGNSYRNVYSPKFERNITSSYNYDTKEVIFTNRSNVTAIDRCTQERTATKCDNNDDHNSLALLNRPRSWKPVSIIADENNSRSTSPDPVRIYSRVACYCTCHKLTFSCGELALPRGIRHCHACCQPCSSEDRRPYNSEPLLNNDAFLTPFSSHSSPSAYLKHLICLRRTIVAAQKQSS